MQKWSVNGLFRMALFALRDIDANEELGYDYNFALFNAAEGQVQLFSFTSLKKLYCFFYLERKKKRKEKKVALTIQPFF